MDRLGLRRLLTERLDLAELEVLCADVDGVLNAALPGARARLDDLGGPTLGLDVLASRLILRLDRYRRLDVLVDQLARQRPDLQDVLNTIGASETGLDVPMEVEPRPERRWNIAGVVRFLFDRWAGLSRRARIVVAAGCALAVTAGAAWLAETFVTRHAIRVTHDWCPASSASACLVVQPPADVSVDFNIALFVAHRQATKVTAWRPGFVGKSDGSDWKVREDTEHQFLASVRLGAPARFELSYDVAGTRSLLEVRFPEITSGIRVRRADELATLRGWVLLSGGVMWVAGTWFFYWLPSWVLRLMPRRRAGTPMRAPSWMP